MRTTRSTLSIAICAAGVLALSSCSSGSSGEGAAPSEEPVAAPVTGSSLSEAVTLDAVVSHLQELSDIADAHDGNRAAGTAGYDASVDYVAGTLRDAGFDVETPEFSFDSYTLDSVALRAADRDVPVSAFTYSPATPAGGVSGPIVAAPADDSPGCEATDYDGLTLTGAVALVPRGVCSFAQKGQIAADRGAAAIIVSNNEDGPLDAGTLGAKEDARIPSVGVSREDGAALAAAPTTAQITLAAETETTTSRNILAQTTTGSTENVVMAGAHLDSVPEGPGINDNGTGTAAVLESALQMGGSPDVTNAVRFGFWGAEELGLVGSTKYVEGLSDEDKAAIALYLNFDMVGSNNAGYLVYDGDDSDQVGEPAGPTGSDAIERVFEEQLTTQDADGTDFDGRSDYGPFIEVGIPSGGVFSGADDVKTEEQAARWGGTANEPFDPNYHTAEDTLENVDREALGINSKAVAYGIGTYAESVTGPNGVPVGADRDAARQAE
ncbi:MULTISPECIES: M28 family peptidase [unclassified Rhodococcus (in: high G+C Gram-positive bacteria)]|uniref:M28 family peptidase n=1 Tax=unclassified Rhodococcus (in: high G+C Gram-positive bacteria) TaxID=192944 RepID=UPI0006F57519|nr:MULTISPECIES: M28 family peptidase [unclassified Rhodococcus (in: high G+C Gram-positive bacteria)]KQU36645.1 amidohydrolase [Rhodococcus sp. Leaf225]KQU49150.1 amidohydrolase [Rhodococcus sp. Leaf258]